MIRQFLILGPFLTFKFLLGSPIEALKFNNFIDNRRSHFTN